MTLEEIRSAMLCKLYDSLPESEKQSYVNLSNHEKLCFLLSGFETKYNNVYYKMYSNTANFVYKMYHARYEIYDTSRMGVT